jgi:hypothetical protein
VPFFRSKARSWDAYLAGIGVSGALMASAFVMFVILVGLVTFKTWPHAGGLLGGGSGDIALQETPTPAPAPARTGTSGLNLVRILGGTGRTAPSGRSDRNGGSRGNGLVPGANAVAPGGPADSPGGSGGGQPQSSQPPPPSSPTQPPNVVRDAVSGLGNTLQSDTDGLGDTLGGSSSPGLGGVVGGVGRTLNSDLQSLAGN